MERRKGGSKPERNRGREGKGKEELKKNVLLVFCCCFFIARYTQAKPGNKLKLIE